MMDYVINKNRVIPKKEPFVAGFDNIIKNTVITNYKLYSKYPKSNLKQLNKNGCRVYFGKYVDRFDAYHENNKKDRKHLFTMEASKLFICNNVVFLFDILSLKFLKNTNKIYWKRKRWKVF